MAADAEKPRGEHLLECLSALAAEEAIRILGVDQERAKILGEEIATRFSSDFGGDMTHIPKGRVFNSSRAHRRIYELFTGDNHAELARMFQVTVIYVYRVIARERERERANRQPPLPGLSGG